MFWVLLLLLAWAATAISCTRLCLAAVHAATLDADAPRGHDLTLYEAAFLSGGPARVADLTLVSMARQHRLLLAHTGWATVVDPRGRDDMERSVIGAIGPEGQSRIAPVRATTAGADSVRRLADHLVAAGLAVPDGARTTVAEAVRQVRAAAAAVLALAATALLLPGQSPGSEVPVAVWFTLPLILTVSCLAIARIEVHPYTRWASPAGQRLLGTLARHSDASGDDRTYLTSVAVRGIRAIGEPEVRAALTHRDHGTGHGAWRQGAGWTPGG
ncbi:TIGR04222 domain-containing membrane protein [Streptomyces sp. NPDC005251]|uniref:TIGR04222 domain-containing membrane protein n=1 Tax=Streptomyces sp. NPDC005251 TaxID=3157166 RepID=UPI0033B6319C